MAVDTKRNFSGGKYAFELDGKAAALVKKFDGLFPKTSVVSTKQSAGYELKTIGNVEYEDATVELGLSMGQGLIDWINASMRGEHIRKAGSIIAADSDGNARSRRDFSEALVTEVSFPACDAASKDTTPITVKFKPEYSRSSPGDGSKIKGDVNTKQKVFLPSNFRLEIGGLPCQTVSKVGAFTFKQAVVVDPIGDSRESQIIPGPLSFTDLDITGGMRDYDKWADWFRDFVLDGNCGQDRELSGSITWLSQNRKDELARVTFHQIGITELKENANEAGKEGVKTWNAKCYFEWCEFEILGA